MAEINENNQAQMTSRQRLQERYKGRDPELNVEDDEALGGAILGDLEAYDTDREKMDRFNKAVQESDIAPGLMSGILSGKNADGSDFNLAEYLLDEHIDYLLDYIDDHDTAKQKMEERRKAREAEEAADADFKAKADELVAAEDAELDAAIAEAGYKPEQVKDLIDWIYDKEKGFLTRAANFELKKDDFLRLFKIKDYDVNMSAAEERGYKKGKNEKIDMFRRQQKKREEMPSDLNGAGGANVPEKKDDPYLSRLEKMKNF